MLAIINRNLIKYRFVQMFGASSDYSKYATAVCNFYKIGLISGLEKVQKQARN